MIIAVLGPKNTFSDLARKHHWPKSKPLYASSIAQVFEWVEKGKAKQGLVPVKNSTSGFVRESRAEFKKCKVRVEKTVSQVIHLALAGVKKVPLSSLRAVYSHPQALLQCKKFLRKHCPSANLIPITSTAAALKRIKRDANPLSAAIAAFLAVKATRLILLQNGIEDNRRNTTTFVLIKV